MFEVLDPVGIAFPVGSFVPILYQLKLQRAESPAN